MDFPVQIKFKNVLVVISSYIIDYPVGKVRSVTFFTRKRGITLVLSLTDKNLMLVTWL